MWLWGVMWSAWAAPTEGAIREELAYGTWLDWTHQVLEVNVVHRHQTSEGQRQAELAAIQDMDVALRMGAKRIRIQEGRTVAEDPTSEALLGRLTRRAVVEARYGREGSIGLTAELPLSVLLGPWTLSRTGSQSLDVQADGYFTGVVLDARGLRANPAWAPRVLGSGGEVLYGEEWADSGELVSTPAVYVPDPTHPEAQRAGDNPLILLVEAVRGVDLRLSDVGEGCLIAAPSAGQALRQGRLVVVVDP